MQDLTSVTRTIGISSPMDRIFASLTEPNLLRQWFAEQVELDRHPGGSFAHWGSTTYQVPDESKATQRIEAWDPPTMFGYRHTVDGTPAISTFELTPDGDGTAVTLTIELPGNSKQRAYSIALDSSALLLYNLREYAEYGRPACTPRYGGPRDRMELSVAVRASARDAFRALVQPETMNRWLGGQAEVEPVAGGRYTYGWTDKNESGESVQVGPTKLIEFEDGRRLVHDWSYLDEQQSTAEWKVDANGDSSTITVTHWGFAPKDDVDGYVHGWASFLCRLKSVLEHRAIAVLCDPS